MIEIQMENKREDVGDTSTDSYDDDFDNNTTDELSQSALGHIDGPGKGKSFMIV